jgi:hypothetical protein
LGVRKLKTIQKTASFIVAGIAACILILSLSACSDQFPLASQDLIYVGGTLSKRSRLRASTAVVETDNSLTAIATTVEEGSLTPRYFRRWGEYNGGKILLSQGSQFELLYGALTPPADLQGKEVTITMTCLQNNVNGEFLFEFGPHGSTFEPAATIWFHYPGTNPKLYYIEDDGSYTEQKPDDLDTVNQWLILKISHFSRYALAWSK